MIIAHRREKIINAILYFAENTNYCGKTKLMKLLYFLDFTHFKQTGKSVTGLDYFAWKKGPVPREVFEEVSGRMNPDMDASIRVVAVGQFHKIVPRKKFDAQYFSKREQKILEEVAFVFRDAKAEDMVESSHLQNQPWDKTLKEKGEWRQIDYLLAIDDFNCLPFDQAKERMEEISEMHKLFGVI